MAQYRPMVLPDRRVEETLPSPWNTDGLYRGGEGRRQETAGAHQRDQRMERLVQGHMMHV